MLLFILIELIETVIFLLNYVRNIMVRLLFDLEESLQANLAWIYPLARIKALLRRDQVNLGPVHFGI